MASRQQPFGMQDMDAGGPEAKPIKEMRRTAEVWRIFI